MKEDYVWNDAFRTLKQGAPSHPQVIALLIWQILMAFELIHSNQEQLTLRIDTVDRKALPHALYSILPRFSKGSGKYAHGLRPCAIKSSLM